MALVNLNADMGESYGRYRLGNDEELIKHVLSANIACGYHAADPGTIHSTVKLARDHGVEIGAHVAYPDLAGFGRRKMGLSEQEVFEITVYQIGAVKAFCKAENVPLNHVKPHGELYLTAAVDAAVARGVVRALKAVDDRLLLFLVGSVVDAECRRFGITMINEGYVDLEYNSDGSLDLDKKREARDPVEVARNAVSLVEKGGRHALDGSWIVLPTQTICMHGDMANGIELARKTREELETRGHKVVKSRQVASAVV
ncbi:5-oxoprolinase subunit PxpA [Pseudaminobacter sp. NGMCC 1.201702]|uniref:5-oxoprolinase subunit PxpA n=1 Tax=Pseudaminobacter sp. NGMCC 1.201702 TaxID=3391825 RepID=UPI0039F084C0